MACLRRGGTASRWSLLVAKSAAKRPERTVHWIRYVAFRKGSSLVRTGSRSRLMCTLCNLTIGLIRRPTTPRSSL